jgi:hypothetical protein
MNHKYFLFPILSGIILVSFFIIFQKKIKINTNQTAVVKQIQQLNRLETAQYTIEKIIDAGTANSNIFQELLYGDKILLIAHGDVIAGFDLSKINKEDVHINGTQLNITLPPPEIFFTKIDNDKTKVYDRKQGLLTKGNKDLESEARKSAENSITKAACDAKILDQATENGKKQMKIIFSRYGFSQVEVIVPPGNC